MTIVPLGFNRSSIALQTNRAASTLASQNAALAMTEQQLFTERQYQHGSDSPVNATTSLSVLALITRKTQNLTNLNATQAFLTATSSVLTQVDPLTDDARAMALDALNTATGAEQRSALAQSVNQRLQSVFSFANNSFGGRYVFTGATTAAMPFVWGLDSSFTVKYTGSVKDLRSWSNTDLLSQSNLNGVDVFGAISDPMRGKDLSPALTAKTLLSDLNGGKGIDKGTIRFTYTANNQQHVVDVDLSKCVTIEDVQRTIENTKNPYFTVNVDITEHGLMLSVPESTVGTVTVSEVGRGTVARQLGLPVNQAFHRNQPLAGKDLNPALTKTTLLSDLLGTKSSLELRFSGSNNDIIIRANHNGSEYDDLKVSIQADDTILLGQERVEYDPVAGEMLIRIHPDNTCANDIIRAINESGVPYTASVGSRDQQRTELAGTGIVSFLPGVPVTFGTTSGGSGNDLDLTGIELVNDNAVWSISFEDCKTVGDMLALLNDPQYGLYATVNDAKNGVDIRSRVSGADFCIGENGGSTASQLGVRSLDLHTRLEALDFGRGVYDYTGPGTNASAKYVSTSDNSALLLTARNEGTGWNDYTLQFVPNNDPQGKVTVSMDEVKKTITIGINPGVTTACEIVEAFASQPGPKQFFDLQLDDAGGLNNGSGVVHDGFVRTSGGTNGGIDFMITRNDGTKLEIDINGAVTIEDVLRIINNHPDNRDGLLTATLSKTGNGIELVDKSFGNHVTRVDRTLFSTAAIELGLVNLGEEYRTKTTAGEYAHAVVNSGVANGALLFMANRVGTYANETKVEFIKGTQPGFYYDANTKTLRFTIESGVTTANDVIDLFQTHAPESVRAMFDIRHGVNASGQTSDGTGLMTLGTGGTLSGGTDSELKGNDPNPQETNSLFTALIRLQLAMEKNDEREIERASQLLDAAKSRLDSAQALLGVMQSSLDNVAMRLSDEAIEFEETLNLTLRIDYQAVSLKYLNQQLAMQSAYQITGMMFQMSLLNYI
jgi:flagellin-like hook-associated protein FlgL